VQWFDGGKAFIEVCLALIVGTTVVRWRYSLRKARGAKIKAGARVSRDIRNKFPDPLPTAPAASAATNPETSGRFVADHKWDPPSMP
jgi:hypothetical protein